jgi:16S rRNA (guanine1207-N2)-methyltransferase
MVLDLSFDTFSFDDLRRWPDIEANNLFAVDAGDRLILDQAEEAIKDAASGSVVVIGDHYGALTLGAAQLGATALRVFQDSLVGEVALTANAEELTESFTHHPLGSELLTGATVVVMQLPRTLAELEEISAYIAKYADPAVVVYAGGRIKHIAITMNEVLKRHFGTLDVSLARQKSRVLIARGPIAGELVAPTSEFVNELQLTVVAHGAVFAGAKLDLGTRFLVSVLKRAKPDASTVIDLGCGTGILAALIARDRPEATVIATDVSQAAVASATATIAANGLDARVSVVRDIGLSLQPDASADLILLNPPFHVGATVSTELADPLFDDAARVLKPGGELWVVFNSNLLYRPTLQKVVGPTSEIARNSKFTVTSSVRRAETNL